MPSRTLTVQNTVPGTRILLADPNRVIFSIFLPDTQDTVYISDNKDDQNLYYLQAGEVIVFAKADGDDTTKEWWARSSTGVNNTILVYEEYAKK